MALDFDEQTGQVLSFERSSDLASDVLTTIFGDIWGDATGSLASGFFEVLVPLHALCAVVIAWIMLVRCVSGSVGAAREGWIGRSLWVPVRFATAMAMITPLAHGLCALHLLVASMVGVSIHMANSMVEGVLGVFAEKSTLTSTLPGESGYSIVANALESGASITGAGRSQGKVLAVQMLRNEAFLYYLYETLGCSVPEGGFARNMREEVDPQTGDHILYFVPDGRMECTRGYVQKERIAYGGFVIPKSTSTDGVITVPMEERVELVKKALEWVEETEAPLHFARVQMLGQERAGVVQDRHAVHAVGIRYARELTQLVQGQGTRSQELTERLASLLAESKQLGWFALGSHYWTYVLLEQELASFDSVPCAWIEPKYYSFAEVIPPSFVTAFWPRINEASYLGEEPSESLFAKIVHAITPFTGLPKRLQESPDALVSTVRMARWVSGTCTAIWLGAETAKLAALSGSTLITKNLLGRVGDLLTGGGEALHTTVATLVADVSFFLKLILLPLWSFATVVAYCVPAIPFVLWICAIGSWLVQVVEAFVAAPLWILAHAIPEGEGFAGRYGRQGYMLLLQMLLRPCLLCIGLFGSFCSMRATGHIIGALVSPFIDGEAAQSVFTLGIVGCIALFVIVVGAVSVLTWKLFFFVTTMPDSVFRWIGSGICTPSAKTSIVEMQAHGSHAASLVGRAATNTLGRHALGSPKKP